MYCSLFYIKKNNLLILYIKSLDSLRVSNETKRTLKTDCTVPEILIRSFVKLKTLVLT